MLTDYDLVAAANAGEKAAFKQLIVAALPRVYPVAYEILGDSAEADDAVQTSVGIALEKLSSLDSPAKFNAWFKTIVVNQAIGAIRKRNRVPTTIAPDDLVAAPESDVDRLIDLRDAIKLLTPYHRHLLHLSMYGLSTAEIASIVDRPPGTARRHISEAYELVRRRMTLGDELEAEAL